MAEENGAGTTFSLVRYNNPVVIDKEEITTRPKSAPASTGNYLHVLGKSHMMASLSKEQVRLKMRPRRYWTASCRPENGRRMANYGDRV